MPSFARELEQTLHNALAEASRRRHEYATLEHLLIALNFSGHEQNLRLPFSGRAKLLISTTMEKDRTGDVDLEEFALLPNEGCLIFL